MKRFFLIFIILFSFQSCKKQVQTQVQTQVSKDWISISNRLKYREDTGDLNLVSGRKTYKIPLNNLPLKRIIFLNVSLLGYITELNSEDKIVGVATPEYIYSDKIRQKIKNGSIANIGSEQKYNVEKILALKPDAVFTNYISTFQNTYDLLEKNGIKIIFLDEYLEQQPLQKSAYIKLFGKLLGKESQAEQKYKTIETEYLKMKNIASKTKNRPITIANEMYGSQWFLPGANTFSGYFFKDAGANYILKDNQSSQSIPTSFEEVLLKAKDAQYWVNIASHKYKNELLAINPNYVKLNVFRNGKLYSINGREKASANDFFESAAVRVDDVLKDYIKIFHSELLPNYQLKYLKELK